MEPERVAHPAPAIGQALGFRHRGEHSVLRNSSLNRLLKDSPKLFCHGDPGLI
jgi:hypothetical protein